MTWQTVGFVLFAAVVLVALWQLLRRDDAEGLLLGALVLAVAFFVLPTRVHERYMFPALALAAPLVLRRWPIVPGTLGMATVAAAALAFLLYVVPPVEAQDGVDIWRIATMAIAAVPLLLATWGGGALYALLSLSFFANVYWVYTADWSFVQGSIINPGRERRAHGPRPVAGRDAAQRDRHVHGGRHDRGGAGHARPAGAGLCHEHGPAWLTAAPGPMGATAGAAGQARRGDG